MSEQESQPNVTGETVLEAQFDRKIGPHTRWIVSGWLVVSVVGIPLDPVLASLQPVVRAGVPSAHLGPADDPGAGGT